MQEKRIKKRGLFAYICYGMLLLLFLLYYRFPSGELMKYIEANFKNKYPGYMLFVEKGDVNFPPGMNFINVRVTKDDHPEMIFFESERFKIRPVLVSLFKDRKRFCFDCTAYEGNISGCLGFKGKNARSNYDTSITISDVDLGKYPIFSKTIGREFEGILNGSVDLKDQSGVSVKGEADLMLSKGKVEFVQPILGISSVNFDGLLMKLLIENGQVEFKEVEIKGKEIQGSFSGQVILKKDIFNSSLNITGTIEPLGGLLSRLGSLSSSMKLLRRRLRNGRLSLKISGTIESPRLRFT